MTDTRRPVPKIGVDMLYVAKVVKDDETGTEYGASVRLPGLNNIGYDPATLSGTYSADDGTYASNTADGATLITLRVADRMQAERIREQFLNDPLTVYRMMMSVLTGSATVSQENGQTVLRMRM